MWNVEAVCSNSFFIGMPISIFLQKRFHKEVIVLGLPLNNISENMKTVVTAKDTELIKCLGKVKETLTVKAKGTHSGE